jgi:hypothetical protein
LLSFNSKLSHCDKNINFNLNLNHKYFYQPGENRYALIYSEHSELARQIYGEKLPQRILRNARTFVNVAQHLRDFGRFEMTKLDVGRQREDRISVAEENVPHEIQKRHFQQLFQLTCGLRLLITS